jgi:hypothetical protein
MNALELQLLIAVSGVPEPRVDLTLIDGPSAVALHPAGGAKSPRANPRVIRKEKV